jgi:hypothetical protein
MNCCLCTTQPSDSYGEQCNNPNSLYIIQVENQFLGRYLKKKKDKTNYLNNSYIYRQITNLNKKNTALLSLFIAFAIQLGHGVIPHHHHHDHHEHHATSGHQHPENEDRSLDHLLSFIAHTDVVITDQSHGWSHLFSKKIFELAFALPEIYAQKEFLLPPLLHAFQVDIQHTAFSYACTFGLRAPPAIV